MMLSKIKQVFNRTFALAIFQYSFLSVIVAYALLSIVLEVTNLMQWPPNQLMLSAAAGVSLGAFATLFLFATKSKVFSIHMGTFNLPHTNSWFIILTFGLTTWMITSSLLFVEIGRAHV